MNNWWIFRCDGYDFYRNENGLWGYAYAGESAPKVCIYASPERIAQLRGCNLMNINWA